LIREALLGIKKQR